jgi:hypothetical protein
MADVLNSRGDQDCTHGFRHNSRPSNIFLPMSSELFGTDCCSSADSCCLLHWAPAQSVATISPGTSLDFEATTASIEPATAGTTIAGTYEYITS